MAAKVEIKKTPQKHKVTHWSHYNNSLKRRGSLELWISVKLKNYGMKLIESVMEQVLRDNIQTGVYDWLMNSN